jgi:hypothetical protein
MWLILLAAQASSPPGSAGPAAGLAVQLASASYRLVKDEDLCQA